MAGNLKRRLGPMDAFFLYSEREEQPMHVGATLTFEGKVPFTKMVRHLESRLHLVPRYRQRVVNSPLNIGHPTWEDDPDFDIRNHMYKVKLPKPGSVEQLRELSDKVNTGTLDRTKPLWEIYLVEGLEDNQTGMIFKVHHAMVDGVAGIGLAFILFDFTPESPKIRKEPFKPEPIPDQSALLCDALWDNAIDGVEHWTNFQRSLVSFVEGMERTELAQAIKNFGTTVANLIRPYNNLPFNGPLSPRRKLSWLQIPFAEARAIRAVAGGTVNDVILTAWSGAVRRFLKSQNTSIPRTMRILVPVNVRQEHERASLGNCISFMPVEVPLHLKDPIERLNAIHLTTHDLKESKLPESVGLMFNALQGTPAVLQMGMLNTVSNPAVQNVMNYVTGIPPANMICTNIPGPNIPLYVLGKRLKTMYPVVPVCMEMGINCAITSYDQKLFLTVCGDAKAGKDIYQITEFLEESFAELREAVEVKKKNYVQITHGEKEKAEARAKAEQAAQEDARTEKPDAEVKTKAKSNGSSNGKAKAATNGKSNGVAKPRKRAAKKKAASRKSAPKAAKAN